MTEELSTDKAEEFILQLLQENERMTTVEVKQKMNNLGLRCTDGPVRVLSKLKFKGKIHGKFSIKARGWVWWL